MKREQRLLQSIDNHKEFLIKRLQEEWDEMQRTAKKEELIRYAKTAGIIVSKTLLVLLAVGGLLTIAAVAPNVFGAYGRLTNRRGFFNKKSFEKSKKYLLRQQYINVVVRSKEISEIAITEKGLRVVLKDAFSNLKIKKVKKWDGFWRITLFDIPNRHKWARDGFRNSLKEIGCYQLQESVFITPCPCEEEIAFLTYIFNVSGYVRLIKTQQLYYDQDVREHFEL